MGARPRWSASLGDTTQGGEDTQGGDETQGRSLANVAAGGTVGHVTTCIVSEKRKNCFDVSRWGDGVCVCCLVWGKLLDEGEACRDGVTAS